MGKQVLVRFCPLCDINKPTGIIIAPFICPHHKEVRLEERGQLIVLKIPDIRIGVNAQNKS